MAEQLRYEILLEDKFTGTVRKITSVSEKELDALEAKLKNTGKTGEESFLKMGNAVKQFLPALTAAGAGFLIQKIAIDSMAAAAQIESYTVTLKTLLGSSLLAMERMDQYKKIAAKTPFELNEVVEAGNKLQSLGRYSEDTLVMLGDLASASGKPFEQVMMAYSKLVTGQKGEAVNLFRDLLITNDDWVKATGKGVSKSGEMLASTLEMEQALGRIMGKKNFMGMMAAQSETTKGKISNLNDSLFQLQAAMGERMQPAQKAMISGMTGIVGSLTEYIAIPMSEKLEQERIHVEALAMSLIDTKMPYQERLSILDELKRMNPDIVTGLNAEAIEYGKLRDNIKKYNDEMVNRIILQKKQEEIDKAKKNKDLSAEDLANRRLALIEMMNSRANEYAAQNVNLGVRAKLIANDPNLSWEEKARNIDDIGRQFFLDNNMKSTGSGPAYFGFDLSLQTEFSRAALDDLKIKQGILDDLTTQKAALRKQLGLLEESGTTTTPPPSSLVPGAAAVPGSSPEQILGSPGGGIKQIIINLDSLIKENNNVINNALNPESDLETFKDKLLSALMSVLNDTNLMITN